jgi:hypothetical protein
MVHNEELQQILLRSCEGEWDGQDMQQSWETINAYKILVKTPVGMRLLDT